MALDLIPLAVTTLDRTALALVVGAAAGWLYLLAPQRAAAPLSSVPLPLLGTALALLAVSGAGDLVVRTAALADVGLFEAWPYLGRALTHSDYGAFWQLRAAAWLVLVVFALFIAHRGAGIRAAWGIAAGAAVIAFAFSSTGHAGDGGSATLPNLVNVLHIAGACLWGGTVVVYAVRILPRLRRSGTPARMLAQTATRLSSLAGAALGLVLATGLYNAWRQLPDWAALWETDYGRALLVKLAMVAVMMAIGAVNRFFVVPAIEVWAQRAEKPAIGGDASVRRFLQLLRIDAAVFILILACAAVLGSQTPPSHMAADDATEPHTRAAGSNSDS